MLQYPHSHLVVPLRNLKPVAPNPPRSIARLPTPPQSPVAVVQPSHAPVSASRSSESSSRSVSDLLSKGDIIGEGVYYNGELVTQVNLPGPALQRNDPPGQHFEVVRKLGSGSYAVVYLVREYFGPINTDDDPLPVGDFDDRSSSPRYGREFAIKCLSKDNLSSDSLQAQLFEATVHQALPVHPNIVTLYRTLETDSLLLLVLESVPGEDLFYFLEQARDRHLESDPHTPSLVDLSVTPPTPSLLSTFSPSQLLSYGRLRLIASMFAQMCDAVAHCHANGVAHRDIKPENFIVTDGWTDGPDGSRERRVIVKLTDFGLATTDIESADMECGSAPYMSYECRNNLAPTYYPRPADVWSLGIVLINMVYHRNPWSDTSVGACDAFERFRDDARAFFLSEFYGMTSPVAEYLAESVFCILETPDDTRRVSASDLGAWIRELPHLMGARARPHGIAVDTEHPQRRPRKRGARKGKSASASAQRDGAYSSNVSLPSPEDERLENLARSNQDLVRELSRLSTRSSATSSLAPSLSPAPPMPRKTSRWKGLFRTNSNEPVHAGAGAGGPVDEDMQSTRPMTAKVSNVSNIIMGLGPASPPSPPPTTERGRRRERLEEQSHHDDMLSPRSPDWQSHSQSRGSERSPMSLRARPSGAASASLGPSFTSNNWRNSMSSSASSIHAGSAYTRFSNASVRSVSTAATSMSGSSWRTGSVTGAAQSPPLDKAGKPLRRPANVKEMNGVPFLLHELPRIPDVQPPSKTPRAQRRPQELSTIAEGQGRNAHGSGSGHAMADSPLKVTVYAQADAATSTTGLSPPHSPTDAGPKKVNKGQINALAKILSTLKR